MKYLNYIIEKINCVGRNNYLDFLYCILKCILSCF